MSHFGVDTAAKITPDIAAKMKDSGVEFIARYLVPNTGKTASKALTAEEAMLIREAGMAVMFVWETTAKRALKGSEAGTADGIAARKLAEEMGVPTGACIYFAVDFDATEEDLPAIEAYYNAAHIALGRYNAGIYGGERVVKYMQNLTPWLWQCVAWSNEFMPFATVIQYQWQGSPDAKALAQEVGVVVDLDTAATLAGMWTPIEDTGINDSEEEKPMYMDWKKFFKAAGIRALRTFAQAMIAAIGGAKLFGDVNWLSALSIAGLAAVLSVLTSIVTGLPEVDKDV